MKNKIGDITAKYRYIFLVLFIVLFSFCLYNFNNVKVNNDITKYLSDDTETKEALNLMEKEYGKFTSISLMIEDDTNARTIYDNLNTISDIKSVSYITKDNKVLYTIQLLQKTDEDMLNVIYDIKKIVSDEEYSIYTPYYSKVLNGLDIVLILSIIVVILILIITSKSIINPIIISIVSIFAIVINMGTNMLIREISYITESIAIILQLALTIDYVIIFMNSFILNIKTKKKEIALKDTINTSIKEVFTSSLTTIAGLLSLLFMQLKLGRDIGLVLAKGVLCSLISVIFLMPSILTIFYKFINKKIEKEKVKNTNLGKRILSNKKILLSVFSVLVVISICLIPNYKFVYNTFDVKPIYLDENNRNLEKIEREFGKTNTLAVIVENQEKDYGKELLLANELNKLEYVTNTVSVGSYEIKDGIYFTSEVTYLELKDILKKYINVNDDFYLYVYKFYANKNNVEVSNINEYKIKIIDLVYFLKEHETELKVDNELRFRFDVLYATINESIKILESDKYTRFIVYLDLPIEGEKTKDTILEIRNLSSKYYDNVLLAGNSVASIDLEESFKKDHLIITFATAIFIFTILLFSFKSVVLSLLLILTIEGSILINFALFSLFGKIFFISYLVVTAIQMGATIDYAIVIANRYLELRKKYEKKEAIILSVRDRLKSIITSGLILIISGLIVGFISPSGAISSIGICLGIGALISLIVTLFILPCILFMFDKYIKI